MGGGERRIHCALVRCEHQRGRRLGGLHEEALRGDSALAGPREQAPEGHGVGRQKLGPDGPLRCSVQGPLFQSGGLCGHGLEGVEGFLALGVHQVNLALRGAHSAHEAQS